MSKMQRNSSIENVYKGESGEKYSREVLESSDECLNAIALNRLRKLSKYVSENDKVLEIGVGLGVNLRLLKVRDRVGYDIGEYGRVHCERYGIRFVSDLNILSEQRFSCILIHHVLEHVPDPLAVINDAKMRLEPGGKIIIFVPNDVAGHERIYRANDINHHLFSWSPMTIGNLIASSGLVVDMIGVAPFGYERFLAPLIKMGVNWYRIAIKFANIIRPVSEITVVARLP